MLKPIILTGEQKKVLFLPEKDPIQIKGVAGSGKTTVALYRAKHLVETYKTLFQEPKIAIFTYNKSLMKYISNLLPYVVGGYQKESDQLLSSKSGLNVKTYTFHSYTYQFLKNYGFWNKYDILNNKDRLNIIEQIILTERKKWPSEKIFNKNVTFFDEEFTWIKGRLIKSKEEYVNTARYGRGIQDKVTKNDKELIYACFNVYNEKIHSLFKVDFEDFAIVSLNYIRKNNSFTPPFTHIIIDEAQDLCKAQVFLLKELVSKVTNSITLIADAAQRIYKSGFSWSEAGINVVGGRTTILKKNYRNSKEIAIAAKSLLDNETDKSDFTDLDMTHFVNTGDKPTIAFFNSYLGQNSFLITELKKIDLKSYSVVILHRCRSDLYRINHFLKNNNIPSEIIDKDFTDFQLNTVKICTLPSIKGLEFDYVFIIDVNSDNLPLPICFTGENDENHISTERRLLYTAMTRAKVKLFIISSKMPSPFLNELSDSSVIKLGKDPSSSQLPFNL